MTHEELNELYELYALGLLDPGEKEEIDEHLARGCPECNAGVRRALEFNAIVATLPDNIRPPKRPRSRVLASVGAKPAVSRWIPVWASIAAAAVVGFGIADFRTTRELESVRGELTATDNQ